MSHAARFAVASLFAVAFAAACGQGGEGGSGATAGGGGGGAGPGVEQTFAAALADAYCGSMAACCSATFDRASCELQVGLGSAYVPTKATAATGAHDPSAAADCLAALAAAASACDPDTAALAAAWDLCQTVYPGSGAANEPCQEPAECAAVAHATRYCNPPTDTSPGGCTSYPTPILGREGDACVLSADPGQPAVRCDPAAELWCDGSACRAAVAAGEPCDGAGTQGRCVDGYICAMIQSPPSKCIPAHGVGEGCWPPKCDIGSDPALCACGAGTDCNTHTQVCEAVAKIGEPCGNLMYCRGSCSSSGACVTLGQSLTWTQYCF